MASSRLRNKARKPAVAANGLSELMEQHVSREKPYRAGDINRFPICTPADHAKNNSSKNCASNPHCLIGLGEKKEGIWSSKQSLVKGLGDDPAMLVRGYKAKRGGGAKAEAAGAKAEAAAGDGGGEKQAGGKRKRVHRTAQDDEDEEDDGGPSWKEVPAGLTNLGATCYLNVLLQLMFANRILRQAVYSFQPPGSTGGERSRNAQMADIMKELQNVFGHLQEGKRNSYDPMQFARLLQLDRGEQQDPVEFSRLFLQKIDECFGAANSSGNLGNVVRGLFRGKKKWVTKCSACQNESGREETFDEVSLTIKGRKSVHECLKTWLTPDRLEGDNKYFCSRCNSKQDALRIPVPTAMPPVINMHLARYEYDPITYQKKKIKDLIFLDEQINFSDLLRTAQHQPAAPPDKQDDIYELVAVLHHKGGSASHGHYTAEIKDIQSGKWWFFDDTEVKPAKAPNQQPPPSTKAKKQQAAADVVVVDDDSDVDPDAEVVAVDDTNGPGGKRKREAANGSSTEGVTGKGSSDAYYLVYVRRGTDFPPDSALKPPADVMAKVQDDNRKLDALIRDFREKKAQLENQISERRADYERLFGSNTPPLAPGQQYMWLPTHWLRCWITGLHLPVKPAEGEQAGGDKKVAAASSSNNTASASSSSGGGGGSSPRVVSPQHEPEVVDMTGLDDADDGKSVDTTTFPSQTSVFCEPISLSQYRCPCSLKPGASSKGVATLDPEKTTELKVVSADVWNALIAEIQKRHPNAAQGSADMCFSGEEGLGDPRQPSYYCKACVERSSHKQEERTRKSQKTDALFKALTAPEPVEGMVVGGRDEQPPMHLLSRKWETLFKKEYEKKRRVLKDTQQQATLEKLWASPVGKGGSGRSDAGGNDEVVAVEPSGGGEEDYLRPNSSLTCVHGDLLITNPKQVRRVTAKCWELVQELFPMGIAYLAEQEMCSVCQAEVQRSTAETKAAKEERKQETKSKDIKSLHQRRLPFPPQFKADVEDLMEERAGLHYKLVSSAWMETWRNYIEELHQPKPEPLSSEDLFCTHQRVLLPKYIIDLTRRTPATLPKVSEVESLGDVTGEILTLDEYQQLLQQYPPANASRPPAAAAEAKPPAADDDVVEVDMEPAASSREGGDWPMPPAIDIKFKKVLRQNMFSVEIQSVTPDMCEECMQMRSDDHEHRLSVYNEVALKLVVLKPGQEPPVTLQNNLTGVHGARRSVRSGKVRGGEQYVVGSVSSTDTISMFRIKSWQLVGFDESKNIKLYYEGVELADSHRTLQSYGVKADATVYGKIVEAADGQGVFATFDSAIDVAGGSGGSSSKANYRPEQGFTGTFLSGFHSPLVQRSESEDSASAANNKKTVVVDVDDEKPAVRVEDDVKSATVEVEETRPPPAKEEAKPEAEEGGRSSRRKSRREEGDVATAMEVEEVEVVQEEARTTRARGRREEQGKRRREEEAREEEEEARPSRKRAVDVDLSARAGTPSPVRKTRSSRNTQSLVSQAYDDDDEEDEEQQKG